MPNLRATGQATLFLGLIGAGLSVVRAQSSDSCTYSAADGASCASDEAVAGVSHGDSQSDIHCTNDEEAKYCQKGDYIFQWVCTPVVCNIVYDYGNSSLSYYFDPVCRKCVSCLVGHCPTLPVMGDSDYCYEDASAAECTDSVDCGDHGTLCSCYQCDCDEGWATNWADPESGYCSMQVSSSEDSDDNTISPADDGGISSTTIWIIVVACAAVLIITALVICCVCLFRKRQNTAKLQSMMEEFQAKALENQDNAHRNKRGVGAKPVKDAQTGAGRAGRAGDVQLSEVALGSTTPQSTSGSSYSPPRQPSAAGDAAAAPSKSWLLHYCKEYKTNTGPLANLGTGAAAMPAHTADDTKTADPLIAPPEFKRQDTLTLANNSPTASLFAETPAEKSQQGGAKTLAGAARAAEESSVEAKQEQAPIDADGDDQKIAPPSSKARTPVLRRTRSKALLPPPPPPGQSVVEQQQDLSV